MAKESMEGKGHGGEEEHVDPNPPIVKYKKKDGVLEIETTHATPVVKTESHNIESAQGQIAKLDGVIALWEAKKKVHQDIIDKYNGLE